MLFLFLLLAALIGYGSATPLLAWGEHLLAGVATEVAAPVAYASATADATLSSASAGATLPFTVGAPWRWGLRLGLAGGLPLLVWHVATGASVLHLPGVVQCVIVGVCVALLALAAVLDGATHLVFAEVITPPALLVGVVALLEGPSVWLPSLVGALVAGGVLGALYLIGHLCYGTDALGWGDVQLGLVFGVLLGWSGALRALVWGLLLMAVIVLALLATRRITLRTYIPLGTFLIAGVLLALLSTSLPWE